MSEIILPNDLGSFVWHMVEFEGWGMKEVIYFLEKPWKWQAEYTAWKDQPALGECDEECAHGGPENCTGCMD